MAKPLNRRLELNDDKTFVLVDTAIPSPPPDGMVIKISYAGMCHTDYMLAHNIIPFPQLARVLGHEISGTIYSIGEQTKTKYPGIQNGDRGFMFSLVYCGLCAPCRSGRPPCDEMYSLSKKTTNAPMYLYGVTVDGGYQEYIVSHHPERFIRIPDSVGLDTAATMGCAGLTSYNAVAKTKESVSGALSIYGISRIGIIGCGGLGLCAIQICKAIFSSDVKVIGISRSDEKLTDAKESGADMTYKWPNEGDANEIAKDLVMVAGGLLDGIVDLVCSQSTMDQSMLIINGGGTYAPVATLGPMPDISKMDFVSRELSFKGVLYGTMAHTQQLLELVVQGKLRAPPMTFIKLEDVPETLKKLGEGKQRGRAVVKHVTD